MGRRRRRTIRVVFKSHCILLLQIFSGAKPYQRSFLVSWKGGYGNHHPSPRARRPTDTTSSVSSEQKRCPRLPAYITTAGHVCSESSSSSWDFHISQFASPSTFFSPVGNEISYISPQVPGNCRHERLPTQLPKSKARQVTTRASNASKRPPTTSHGDF